MTRLEFLGLLVLNPYLHSITAMPDTSPVVHKMPTIKFNNLIKKLRIVNDINLHVLQGLVNDQSDIDYYFSCCSLFLIVGLQS